MIVWIIVAAAVWLVCGIIAYGASFAYFQGKYALIAKQEYRADLRFSIVWGLLGGPIALFILWIDDGFRYGLRFK